MFFDNVVKYVTERTKSIDGAFYISPEKETKKKEDKEVLTELRCKNCAQNDFEIKGVKYTCNYCKSTFVCNNDRLVEGDMVKYFPVDENDKFDMFLT